jgi:NAD(P)-dependent dehydrogenase (short-subunit alcohol dehydrogenase family)
MTHTLAMEWATHGIRVNSISPGFVRTQMTAKIEAAPDFETKMKVSDSHPSIHPSIHPVASLFGSHLPNRRRRGARHRIRETGLEEESLKRPRADFQFSLTVLRRYATLGHAAGAGWRLRVPVERFGELHDRNRHTRCRHSRGLVKEHHDNTCKLPVHTHISF